MIKAIETRYAGCRFRSRLEARWAVFFDRLGIEWEYEPQGYELPAGKYLPDFLLKDVGGDACDGRLWFEVKPDVKRPQASDDPRWEQLAQMTSTSLIVAWGMPRPDHDIVWGSSSPNGWMEAFFGDRDWDNGRAFTFCCMCDRIGISFEGRCGRVCDHPGVYDQRCGGARDPRILDAYTTARSARFEHGESGAR